MYAEYLDDKEFTYNEGLFMLDLKYLSSFLHSGFITEEEMLFIVCSAVGWHVKFSTFEKTFDDKRDESLILRSILMDFANMYEEGLFVRRIVELLKDEAQRQGLNVKSIYVRIRLDPNHRVANGAEVAEFFDEVMSLSVIRLYEWEDAPRFNEHIRRLLVMNCLINEKDLYYDSVKGRI